MPTCRTSKGRVVDVPFLNFAVSADDIAASADAVITESDRAADLVATMAPPTEAGVAALVQQLTSEFDGRQRRERVISALKDVGVDADVRAAATAAFEKIQAADTKRNMRVDVFAKVAEYHRACDDFLSTSTAIPAEHRRLIARLYRDGIRRGLHLSTDVRAKIEALTIEESGLAVAFETAIAEDASFSTFTREHLSGLPDDYFTCRSLDADGKFIVKATYPDVFPILEQCRVPETRRSVLRLLNRRGADAGNATKLLRLAHIRHERATALGFPTHAHYMLEVTMAKSPGVVGSFLDELQARVKPVADKELAALNALKVEDGFTEPLASWDLRYYTARHKKANFSVDVEEVRACFGFQDVLANMMDVYASTFKLGFEQLTDLPHECSWADPAEVSTYVVLDAETDTPFGVLYFDLYPRPGKFSHAMAKPLLSPVAGGTLPVVALVCNFPRESSLLSHDDLETLFHEFGHAVHFVCARPALPFFDAFEVETDFVELPSQMLENWCWDADVLVKLSGGKLPTALAERIVCTRSADIGLQMLRQIMLSRIDEFLHRIGPTLESEDDLLGAIDALQVSTFPVPPLAGTSPAYTFAHLASGYDSRYYSYLWSEVYSADVFASVFSGKGKLLEASVAEAGAVYRRCVLEPGATQDGMDMITRVLGRPPSVDAFFDTKGL